MAEICLAVIVGEQDLRRRYRVAGVSRVGQVPVHAKEKCVENHCCVNTLRAQGLNACVRYEYSDRALRPGRRSRARPKRFPRGGVPACQTGRRGGGLSPSKSTAAGRSRCLPSADPRCGQQTRRRKSSPNKPFPRPTPVAETPHQLIELGRLHLS